MKYHLFNNWQDIVFKHKCFAYLHFPLWVPAQEGGGTDITEEPRSAHACSLPCHRAIHNLVQSSEVDRAFPLETILNRGIKHGHNNTCQRGDSSQNSYPRLSR